MAYRTLLAAVCAACSILLPAWKEKTMALRPPAVPLITHDPYFSVWSFNDRLTDDWTRHWTGAVHAMCGLVRIDGKTYRYAGPQPQIAPALNQTHLEVQPTRTTYIFEGGGIQLALTFLSPLLPHNLELVSRPVTYLTWEVKATDGKPHDVAIYFDVTGEWVVNTTDQTVQWSRYRLGEQEVLRIGSPQQPVLEKAGDNLRIDWGHLYATARNAETALTGDQSARMGFVQQGAIPTTDDLRMPRPARDEWPVLAFRFALPKVGDAPVTRRLMLAYDDLFSIEYFHRKLRPYWRWKGAEIGDLLQIAEKEYDTLKTQCAAFDAELMADAKQIGGAAFVSVASLAYRQCLAAHKLVVDADGTLLYFSKENFSNGCIGTVDVTYPSAPFFLLLNPTLLKAQLTPILDYARSGRWKFPFAPHDLGTYPKANGQVYGGGERSEENQMPVEECGNMLILVAALAKAEGNADYAAKYWSVLSQWADYLREKGLDPENQLCTDDFAGHLAHNTNLSLKAIMALGSFAQMCETLAKRQEAAQYRKIAEEMAKRWQPMAKDAGHYRLAFDRPGTWSQKYNLVWDRLLELNLFPPDLARDEIASYKPRQNKYGLPLDNRAAYTKLDWVVWTATLAEKQADFEALIAPLATFLNESPSRVPMTDWYDTVTGKQVGFQARSVVGGVYIPFLKETALWKKWVARKP
jgi:hypothetical protein